MERTKRTCPSVGTFFVEKMRIVKIVWKISRKKETPANVGLCLLKRKIYISMIGKQDDLQDEINIYQ